MEKAIGEIVTKDYTFSVGELDGKLLCHVSVLKWNKTIYKKMVGDFYEIRKSLGEDMYCNILKRDKVAQKLAGMFGFFPKYVLQKTILMGL